MSKSLVIVESPAKAKTINKYLGNEFVVKSSVGHVRDLPTGSKGRAPAERQSTKGLSAEEKAKLKKKKDYKALVTRMGIDPKKSWEAHYEVLPGKEKVVNELRKIASSADTIYLATDLDREGEAIAWHLQQIIGGEPERYRRVVFNEITKNAIQEAFSQPGELNVDRVNAQQTRRFLDRVVGFMVSPLLWKKISRGLSAGRVQSVAVRLVVEREREIKAFVPDEYWNIHANTLTQANVQLQLEAVKYNGSKLVLSDKQATDVVLDALKPADFVVSEREDKPTTSRPSAPFITSTLQQAASTRLGFGVKKTMTMAQRLYEAGYITYMRTDSTNLSQEAVATAREFISEQYGESYLPAKALAYGSKEGAQEAHEAIRPSEVTRSADSLGDMERDAVRLYELIWRQFVACQMVPAKYDASTIRVNAAGYELTAKGRTLRFDGWTRVQPPAGKKEDVVLPSVVVGDHLALQSLDPSQHFTKPPARFSEASLVKELEKRGIGRPSTYASIISTIQDRGYVRVDKRRFYAEKMGEIVNDRLVENFSELLNFSFTAEMEDRLDEIASGQQDWKAVLDQFYTEFKEQLDKAELPPEEGGMRRNEMVLTEIECPTCARKMGIRTASTGVFLGCEGYNLPPKERCTTTLNLVPGDEAVAIDADDEAEAQALVSRRRCDKCGTSMDSYLLDEQRKLHICGNAPTCDGFDVEIGQFKIKGYDGPVLDCDKCGAEMQLKSGRFGKYFGCTNSECKNTRKLLKSGEAAPPKEDPVQLPELKCEKSDAHFVLRDGAAGIFLAASTFPKSRETRAPFVDELRRFRSRISPKFHYLADAPATDDKGNRSLVRFSRKTKTQYVTSEVNGKQTGWMAVYEDDKWRETVKTPAVRKKKK